MCPLCGDAKEMDLDHNHMCQSLIDAMDNVNNWDRWWKLSKVYWTARRKMWDIPVIGVGLKKTTDSFEYPKVIHKGLTFFLCMKDVRKSTHRKKLCFYLISFITQQCVNKQCNCMPTELCSYCTHSSWEKGTHKTFTIAKKCGFLFIMSLVITISLPRACRDSCCTEERDQETHCTR